MTVTLNLELLNQAYHWALVHYWVIIVAWYVLAIPLTRYLFVWTKEEFERNKASADMPAELQSLAFWIFSPLIFLVGFPLYLLGTLLFKEPK